MLVATHWGGGLGLGQHVDGLNHAVADQDPAGHDNGKKHEGGAHQSADHSHGSAGPAHPLVGGPRAAAQGVGESAEERAVQTTEGLDGGNAVHHLNGGGGRLLLRLIELLGQLLHGAGGQCSGDREGDEQPRQEDQGEVKIQERVSRWMRPNRGAPIAGRRPRAAPAISQQKARMIEGRTGPRSATVYEGRASLALP